MKYFKQDVLPLHCISSLDRTEKHFPKYDEKQMADLVGFIKEGGDAPAITISEKFQIIDGYNRFQAHKIAEEDTILCDIFSYSSEDEMEMHGIILNAKRRHLDSVTMARMAQRLAELMRPKQEDVKKARVEGGKEGGRGKKKPSPTQAGEGLREKDSIEKAAKQIGVSPKTVRAVKKVDDTKDVTLISAMESREISLEKAAMFASIEDPAERKQAVKDYLASCDKALAPLIKMSEELKGRPSAAGMISAACLDCLCRLGKADKAVKYDLMTPAECDHQIQALASVMNKANDMQIKIKNQMEAK